MPETFGSLVTRLSAVTRSVVPFAAALVLVPLMAHAQQPAPGQQPGGQPPTFQLPPVMVSAQKEPADAQTLPVSVTAVPAQTMLDAGVETVSDAAVYAPNTHFTEFSARKLSNARFRGIGSSPANPSITTYVDGVPQLNANSSSLDLLQIDQLEFVRGAQTPLFGRNSLGGVINVTTRRPAVGGDWTGSLTVPFANYGERGVRGAASGPVVGNRLGAGVAFQFQERDGFTRNSLTGNTLDDRSSFSAKGQLLWTPSDRWEARVILSGERARDGDYALTDIDALRRTPFTSTRDFEGFTERDIVGTTVLTRWDGARVAFSTTTGFVSWRTEDSTDLDYLPFPFATRDNREESFQFTQEVRLASAENAPVRVGDGVSLRWQSGVFAFTQDYEQHAVNNYSALFVQSFISSFLDFPLSQNSPQSTLDDVGVGVYGQGTFTFGDRFDVTAGVRADHERKDAVLNTFTTPALPFYPTSQVTAERNFSDVSPQLAVALRMRPDRMVYAAVARGFKAGGFNSASPVGREAYEEEHTWNLEGGVKTRWAAGRVTANAAVFRIDWDELQLNLPDPDVPGQFFIDNAGSAVSAGAELEISVRAREGLDVFGSLGYTRARFDGGVVLGGLSVGGNEIPHTPDFTTTIGAQLSHLLRPGTTIYGRGEATVRGAFHYDEANTAGQDTYALANFRAGVRFGLVFVEGWVRNAFDTHYIPVAFAYAPFAPSGFIGEMGRPRTFGVNAGVSF